MSDREYERASEPYHLYRQECPYCGNSVLSNEWGGACRECGCARPDEIEPADYERWIADAEQILALNADAPEEQRAYLRQRIAEWRQAARRAA